MGIVGTFGSLLCVAAILLALGHIVLIGFLLFLGPLALIVAAYSSRAGLWGPRERDFDIRGWHEGLTRPFINIFSEVTSTGRALLRLSWVFCVVTIGGSLFYLATHGQVHRDRYYYGYLQYRPATRAEIAADQTTAICIFASIALQLYIYPAVYWLFHVAEQPKHDDSAAVHT